MPVKPLMAEIEARYEKFPLPIYNEIRAMNDHVARAFTATDEAKAKEQIEKAFNHIRRITRDCYKALNLYYKREAEEFDDILYSITPTSKKDFERLEIYGELSDRASELVEYAKLNETLVSDEEVYQNYQESYHAYKKLHKFIGINRGEILSIKKKKGKEKIMSIVFSAISFIFGCVLTNNNQAIWDFIKQMLHL